MELGGSDKRSSDFFGFSLETDKCGLKVASGRDTDGLSEEELVKLAMKVIYEDEGYYYFLYPKVKVTPKIKIFQRNS